VVEQVALAVAEQCALIANRHAMTAGQDSEPIGAWHQRSHSYRYRPRGSTRTAHRRRRVERLHDNLTDQLVELSTSCLQRDGSCFA